MRERVSVLECRGSPQVSVGVLQVSTGVLHVRGELKDTTWGLICVFLCVFLFATLALSHSFLTTYRHPAPIYPPLLMRQLLEVHQHIWCCPR